MSDFYKEKCMGLNYLYEWFFQDLDNERKIRKVAESDIENFKNEAIVSHKNERKVAIVFKCMSPVVRYTFEINKFCVHPFLKKITLLTLKSIFADFSVSCLTTKNLKDSLNS